MTSRPSTVASRLTIVPAVFALIAVPLGAYVGGYFWLGSEANVTTPAGPVAVRIFRYRWQAVMFTPAASVDSFVRNRAVEVFSNEEISQLR